MGLKSKIAASESVIAKRNKEKAAEDAETAKAEAQAQAEREKMTKTKMSNSPVYDADYTTVVTSPATDYGRRYVYGWLNEPKKDGWDNE